jgi:transposase-like protein
MARIGITIQVKKEDFSYQNCQRKLLTTMRYVSYKHVKALAADLKSVYSAGTEEEALENLMIFKDKWDNKYPAEQTIR